MIDQTTADLEKLRLYAAYAKRIEKVIFDAGHQLDKERETLLAQIDRAQDHVVLEKKASTNLGEGSAVFTEGGKAIRA